MASAHCIILQARWYHGCSCTSSWCHRKLLLQRIEAAVTAQQCCHCSHLSVQQNLVDLCSHVALRACTGAHELHMSRRQQQSYARVLLSSVPLHFIGIMIIKDAGICCLPACTQLACRKQLLDSEPTCSCFSSPLRSSVSLIAAVAQQWSEGCHAQVLVAHSKQHQVVCALPSFSSPIDAMLVLINQQSQQLFDCGSQGPWQTH